jgi:hypothetical protein
MKNQESNELEAGINRTPTAAAVGDSEKKLDNPPTPESALGKKGDTPSNCYQRSRNAALMKLALLRDDDSETA